ncbi:hypothetical protein COV16_00125, partial [Candidatus Woesearchaeota archaeon CG10_big_fil_rev_8_21_14_0_10_34_8]
MGKRSSLETILALGLASSGCVPDESKEYNPGNIDDTVVQQDDTGNPESPTLQVDDLYITMDTDSMELGEVVAVNYSGELNCAYDNVPTGFTGLESCEFTYDSHGINDATNEIKVDVSADGYNPANARIIITVGEGGEENSAPVILTNSLPDATVDEYYEAEISVSDAEGDDISCSLDTTRYAVPTWMNIDDCVLYGTPTDSGMVDVPLTAMDSKGSYVEADLELYVGEENDTVVYTVTVQTPDTKDPIVGAYVSLDCNNGDFITDIADSKGEITGTLTSQTTCEVYANDDLTTPEYVAYLWDHDFTIGNNSITAEIYDNDPSVYDPENVSEDCFGGNIETMRDMLMYGNGMKHKTLGDSGRREFERFSEDELTSPIKYWISDIDDDGEEVSEYVYNNMYDAVTEGLGVMNSN